jgi:putative colanic acid biosynthesis acetyltransferase WcaF
MKAQNLSTFNNSWYKPGGNSIKRLLWYFTNAIWFKSSFPLKGFKVFLLRLYGANVGKGLVIKPYVSIKYPWRLTIGDNVWIGEEVWIDNLDNVVIENNVCISQGAMLLCGNHDYKKTTFDLIIAPIILKSGSWIGAKSTVCPGTYVGENAILNVQSVASGILLANTIYRGNPAIEVKKREIE